MQTASAWKRPRPFRAPKPAPAKPVKRAIVDDIYGNTIAYAASATGESGRPASFYDVLAACQEKANETGQPLDIVRVYVLRSAAACRSPSPRDWAACAERYMGVSPDDSRTHHDRLPFGRAVAGALHLYAATVYPEDCDQAQAA